MGTKVLVLFETIFLFQDLSIILEDFYNHFISKQF